MSTRRLKPPTTTAPASRVEVTDLRATSVAAYARHQPGSSVHLERRGGRTYLVTE